MSESLFSLLEGLPSGEGWTDQDRYRAFRRVFMDTDEGPKVLREILSWCHMFRPSMMGNPVDPYRVVALEAERNLALRLMAAVTVEPPEKPTQTKRKS